MRALLRIALLAPVLLCAAAAHGQVQLHPDAGAGYFRYPTLHGSTVLFTAEGDLWRVPLSGGQAQRLTTHRGEETRARVSPDGRTIAFSATYEGPTEVYTMPIDGGPPTRRTWDGAAAAVVNWTPDGRILYATRKYSSLPATQLHVIDPATNVRTPLPLAQAAEGSLAADGTLYFTRLDFQGSHTKRYRGGTVQNIWKLPASAGSVGGAQLPEAVPLSADYLGTSRSPMVWNGRVYFASDRTQATSADSEPGVVNIWSSSLDGGDVRQHTRHTTFDVQNPSLHDGRIVYQQGADIWVLDVAASPGTEAIPRRLRIQLTSDFDHMREQWVRSPMDYFTSAHLSPTGDRVVITARGHVFTTPVGSGQGRFVLATPQHGRAISVRFRDARFMPDGRSLAVLSDESGEVELWTVPVNGIGARTQLTRDADILRWDALPSPDGKWILHHDKNQKLYLYDVARRTDRVIATSSYQAAWISSAPGFSDAAWSSDARYIAFNDVAPNMFGRIAVYDTQTGETVYVTSDRYDSWSPTWSADGEWLYFLSDRTLNSTVGSPWGMRAPEPFFDNQTKIYAVAMKPGAKWPFAARTELDADSGAAPASARTSVPLRSALFEVPLSAGNYTGLAMDGSRLYYLTLASRSPFRRNLMSLELKPQATAETFMENVASYELSQDRRKLLVRRGTEMWVVNAAARAPANNLNEFRIDLSGWSFPVDPRAEWRQMFVDAWRLERDYFYDPAMHGVDWAAMRDRYLPLVDRVTDRAELSDVIAQMVAELSALHIFVRGGDLRRGEDNVLPASLGAVLERAGDGWRVQKIYRSDPDIPDELSPLAQPGVNVNEGDVIAAINGIATATADPSELLRNQAGRQVLLRVLPAARRGATGAAGNAAAPFDVVVTPITQGREVDLRYDEWEYTRRLAVDSMTDRRIGYVHIRNMGSAGMAEFAREYYPQFNRDGLIIDVRNNTGGNIDAWLLGRLMRQAWFYWQPRVGEPYWNMQYAFRGPMVVLVNENTASDGEAFAEGFRRLGLGKVIGTRTWGGEVWLSSSNFLVDRGIATAAEQGVYGPEEQWLIEGWGVDPDVVVDNLPAETFRGRDRQLEAAVRELEQAVRESGRALPRIRR